MKLALVNEEVLSSTIDMIMHLDKKEVKMDEQENKSKDKSVKYHLIDTRYALLS